MKLILTLCASLLLLAGCVSGGNSTSAVGPTGSAAYQANGFSWRSWAGAPNLYMMTYNPASAIRLSNGRVITGGTWECLGMGGPLLEECYNAVVDADRAAGFTTRTALVNAGRQAVQASGRCTWLGYDPALDARTRATGALASQGDNRFFFVRLQCP